MQTDNLLQQLKVVRFKEGRDGAVLATLAFLALLITQTIPLGVGSWIHPFEMSTNIFLCFIPIAMYVQIRQMLTNRSSGREMVVYFLVFQIVFMSLSFGTYLTIPAVVMHSGYSQWADTIVASDFLNYNAFITRVFESGVSTKHISSHPPGFMLLHWVVYEVVDLLPIPDHTFNTVSGYGNEYAVTLSDAVYYGSVGVLVILLASLTVIVLNWLDGHWAVLMFILSPAIITQSPNLDLLLPLFTVLAFWLHRHQKYFWLGVVLSVGYYFNYLFAIVVLIITIYHFLHKRSVDGVIHYGTLFLIFILLFALFGANPLTAFEYHSSEGELGGSYADARPYTTWVWGTPYMFLLFLGIPITAMTVWSIIRFRDKLAISFFAVLILLSLSGLIRGESERILLFLVPIPCMAIAAHVNMIPNKNLFFGLLFMQTLVFKCFFDTMAVMSGAMVI